jgi:hypothetical protein
VWANLNRLLAPAAVVVDPTRVEAYAGPVTR